MKNGEKENYNDDDEDDRKTPPAKEIVVKNNGGKRREEPQENQDQNNNNRHVNSPPRSMEDTDETTSIISSSVSFAATPAAASPQTPAAASPPPPPSSVVTRLDKPIRRLWQDERPGTASSTSVMMDMFRSVPSWSPQQQLALVLLSTTVMSMTAFIYFILPFSAIVAFGIGTTSFGLLLQQTYFYLMQDLNNRIEHGHGLSELLAAYIPPRLMQTLTRISLHDYMTDNSLVLEYRFLMLYFVPGLSQIELNAYIDRLAPRHREMLRRPGLGQFLGPNFMRTLIGRQAWEQMQHGQQIQQGQEQGAPPGLPPPPPQIQLLEMQDRQAMDNAVPADRNLFDQNSNQDDSQSSCSDLGLAVTTNDMAGGLSESQATRMARQLGLISSSSPPTAVTPTAVPLATTLRSPNAATPVLPAASANAITTTTPTTTGGGTRTPTPEQQEEGNVLREAFWSGYNYYYNTAMDTVRRAIVPSVRGAVIRVGVIGAMISIPVVVLDAAFWTDALSSSFSFLSRFWSRTTTGNTIGRNSLWTGVVLGGGVTAGVVLYATTTARPTSTTIPQDKKNEQTKDDRAK